MTQRTTTPVAVAAPDVGPDATRATRALLACGVVAGPLFVVVGLVQASTRDGFDLGRHQLSLLSLGDLGWIQIVNFVISGLLFLAGAAGMWRVLRPGPGGTWGPLLIAGYGSGCWRPDCSPPTRPSASHPGLRREPPTD